MKNTTLTISAALSLLLLGAVAAGATDAATQTDAALTAEERARAIGLLEDSHRELLALVEGLSDEAFFHKPDPDRWSVAEVVEHLLRTEEQLFPTLEQVLASAPNPEWKKQTAGKIERIEGFMGDRSTKVQAPSVVTPKGGVDRAELMTRFTATRERTLKFARETEVPIKQHTSEHPGFGTLNVYQWLLFFPLHNQRHNQQIVEIKATPGFPG